MPDRPIAAPAERHGRPSLSILGNRVFSAWLGNGYGTFNNGIGYCYSLDAGLTWTNEPGPPVGPPFNSIGSPTAAALTPAGDVHLITDFNGVQYFRGSGSAPIHWSASQIAVDVYSEIDGYDQPSIVYDPALGYVYLCVTEGTPSLPEHSASTIIFARSVDNGASWQPPLRMSTAYCKGSSMVLGPDGTIFVVYVDYLLGEVMLQRSTDHGASFQSPTVVSSIMDNLGTLPIGWTTDFPSRSYPYYLLPLLAPNFPALAIDRSPAPTRGSMYVTWTERSNGTPNAATASIVDTGPNDTYDSAQPVPLDCNVSGSLPTNEFGAGESDYYVFNGTAGETVWIGGSGSNGGVVGLLDMEMSDGTKTLVTLVWLLPAGGVLHAAPPVLTLPRSGRYFLHFDSGTNGVSYGIQLGRFTLSPSVALDMRDIVLVRSTDGGATWSPKIRVNHDAAGADQAMPNVAVDGGGDVYVAWYDRRNSADGDSVEVYASVSGDGGKTFGSDLRLSSRPSSWVGHGDLVGDRVAIAAGNDYAIAAWPDFRNWPTRADIYAARIIDAPTAIEAVSDLSGEPVADGVELTWHVNDSRTLSALRVFRATDGIEVALGAADLPPTHEGLAHYLDTTVEPGETYTYRLRVRSGAGISWIGPIAVAVPNRVTALSWRSTSPNPFTQHTKIRLAVPRTGVGFVRVYDVQGKEVRTIAQGAFPAGERTVDWDGKDTSGGTVPAGLYFVTARIGDEQVQVRVARVP